MHHSYFILMDGICGIAESSLAWPFNCSCFCLFVFIPSPPPTPFTLIHFIILLFILHCCCVVVRYCSAFPVDFLPQHILFLLYFFTPPSNFRHFAALLLMSLLWSLLVLTVILSSILKTKKKNAHKHTKKENDDCGRFQRKIWETTERRLLTGKILCQSFVSTKFIPGSTSECIRNRKQPSCTTCKAAYTSTALTWKS